MKNFILIILLFFCTIINANADEIKDIQTFFNEYINCANNYEQDFFNFYTNNAKIIRVVEKPDGTYTSVNIPIDKYKKEVKKSTKLMRLRKYKNNYYNVKITQLGEDYKISALRMPSTSNYKIPAHFIVGKDNKGEWKIKEESMNTKVQKFLESN
ncbi:MAG: hypothetical protein E7Z90_01595 [Cyanobacteria bacterium SIG29]|nr:hypothetical protein [Cyanobacteria bacterium SIG29]